MWLKIYWWWTNKCIVCGKSKICCGSYAGLKWSWLKMKYVGVIKVNTRCPQHRYI